MTFSRIALVTSLLALTASTAFAGIVRVGPNRTYTTIQDGLDHASDGDTILIDKGTYKGQAWVTTADLTIRPAKKGKKGKVTIDGEGTVIPLLLSSGSNGCVVRDLHISHPVTTGIAVISTSDITIIRCTVTGDVEGSGIYIWGSKNCAFVKCKVLNANDVGILIGSGSLGAAVKKCKVKDSGGHGMLIASDSVTVTNNKVIRPGDDGIVLGDGVNMHECTGSLINENRIEDAHADSLEVSSYASHCVIQKNVIRNGDTGVFLSSSDNHLLTGNLVVGSTSDSFWANDCAWTKLYKNVARDSKYESYQIESNCTYVDLVKNKSRRAGDNGFEIWGDLCTLMHNDSRKSNRLSGTGLDFETAGATNLLYSGNIYDTSDF